MSHRPMLVRHFITIGFTTTHGVFLNTKALNANLT